MRRGWLFGLIALIAAVGDWPAHAQQSPWQVQCERRSCSVYRFAQVARDDEKKEPIEGKRISIGVVVSRDSGAVSVMAFDVPDGSKGEAVAVSFYSGSPAGGMKSEETVVLPYQRCSERSCLAGVDGTGLALSQSGKKEVNMLALFQDMDVIVFNYFLKDQQAYVAAAPLYGFKEALGELMAELEMGKR
jgi:hypothetical protein